jgi:glycosyltransferase domain-containing protein
MITILIPTKNRSDFLIRLLNYYATTKYKHWISIGDSSDSLHINRTKECIGQLKNRLKIIYQEYPNFSEPECTSRLIQSVSTPYLTFCPDDDFLIPESISRCINFLEKHPEYSVVVGKAILFTLKNKSGPYGEFENVSYYNLRSISADSARERLLDHLANYSNPNFGVHRTKEFQEAYGNVILLKDGAFTEILANCMSCIQGKIKQLNCFYLIRQGHNRRYLLPDIYDWLTGKDWFDSYRIFHDTLVLALMQREGIDERRAQDTVKEGFWHYLYGGFSQKFDFSVKARLKKRLKNIPLLGVFLQKIKSRLSFLENMSLQSLLNKASPYYDNFLPIYQAVTGFPKE